LRRGSRRKQELLDIDDNGVKKRTFKHCNQRRHVEFPKRKGRGTTPGTTEERVSLSLPKRKKYEANRLKLVRDFERKGERLISQGRPSPRKGIMQEQERLGPLEMTSKNREEH